MEHDEQFTISERSGTEFTVRPMTLGFNVWYGRFRVGHAYCRFFGDFMELHDLCIENEVIQPSNNLLGRLFRRRKL